MQLSFESLLSHLGSFWAGAPGVTFESLLGHFSSFCVSVDLGARPLHKRSLRKPHDFVAEGCREVQEATDGCRLSFVTALLKCNEHENKKGNFIVRSTTIANPRRGIIVRGVCDSIHRLLIALAKRHLRVKLVMFVFQEWKN